MTGRGTVKRVAAESKIDPMHQFQISPLAGDLDGNPFVFTNSALWMLVVLALIWLFMLGGMKRELVPGRWQVAVEGVTGFITLDGDDQHRPRRAQIHALGVHGLHVHPVRQSARA